MMTILVVMRPHPDAPYGPGQLEFSGWFEDSIAGQKSASMCAVEVSGFIVKITVTPVA